MDTLDLQILPPICERCRSPLKPNCVLFGEDIPFALLRRSKEAALTCDVMLVIGTSGSVYPVADLPKYAKQVLSTTYLNMQVNATVIEINPELTEQSDLADICILEKAGTALGMILSKIQELRSE